MMTFYFLDCLFLKIPYYYFNGEFPPNLHLMKNAPKKQLNQ